jgi:hypothetical protein
VEHGETHRAAFQALPLVTTGLDPVVHADSRLDMDCRIKSGNDEVLAARRHFTLG